MDQVGVKAPGSPTKSIALSLAKSARLCFSGGNPRCRSTLGSMFPTEANPRRDEDSTNRLGKLRLPREARRVVMMFWNGR